MSQNGYPAYTTYEAGAAYFNGPISAPLRPFDGRAGPPPSAAKQMEPGMQAILNGERHPITYTYPGYEGSFHGTPPIDQNLQALLSGHRPYASARDTSVAYSNPIANFYHDADGPWNSVRATNQAGGSTANATLTVPVPNLDYNSYRDAPPSEISDSGYASQAAASQSVVNTNAEPPDYNRECATLPVQVNSFPFTAIADSSPSYDAPSFQTRNADGADLSSASQPTRAQKQLQCPRCGEIAKCRSDFKKHQLKHTKPHTCDQPDCTRKEGFATTNDLDRHKKSVHNIPGLTKSFRCAADRCKNKDKIWPRLDNFKQHVQRMHKGQNQNDLIQRSVCFNPSPSHTRSVSPIDNALAGIDSKSGNLDVANHKDSPDLVINQRRDDDGSNSLVPDGKSSLSHTYARQCQWEQGDFQQYQGDSTQPLVMSGDQQPSQISPPDAPKLRQLATAAVTADSQPTSQATSKNGSNKVQSSKCAPAMEDGQKRLYSKFSNIIASSIANGAANESLNKAVLRALMELGQNKHIVATTSHRKGPAAKEAQTSSCADRSPPGSPGPDGTEATMSTAEVKTALATLSRSFAKNPDAVPNGKAGKSRGFECPDCPRVSKRRCDLNKHIKRHTKPYGCTFSKCYGTFGSKNDWRRHEDKKHYEQVAWRCEQPPCDGISTRSSPPPLTDNNDSTASSNMPPKVCGDLFYDNDAFANHLRFQHSLPENKIFTELNLRRIGENFQSRFWCGFCERVLPLKERGSKAWDERYNHIDDHFKVRSINDWLDVEIKKRKGILKKEMEMDRRDFTDREGDWQDNMESEGGALRRSTEADVLVLAVPKGKNNGDVSDGGSMAVAGRKRSHEEMEVVGGGGDDDSRARVRNRADAHGDEGIRRSRSKSKKGETLFYCCRCRQGPYAWSLYQSCLDCEHEFCTTCDRRKHESEAEENVDYSLRKHIKNASSSQA